MFFQFAGFWKGFRHRQSTCTNNSIYFCIVYKILCGSFINHEDNFFSFSSHLHPFPHLLSNRTTLANFLVIPIFIYVEQLTYPKFNICCIPHALLTEPPASVYVIYESFGRTAGHNSITCLSICVTIESIKSWLDSIFWHFPSNISVSIISITHSCLIVIDNVITLNIFAYTNFVFLSMVWLNYFWCSVSSTWMPRESFSLYYRVFWVYDVMSRCIWLQAHKHD